MKKVIALLVLVMLGYYGSAQYYYYNDDYYDSELVFEIGPHAGTMYALTDVGGKKTNRVFPIAQLHFKDTRLASGFYVAAMYRQTYGLRVEATWGNVQGNDRNGINKNRGLSYRSSINEIALIGEIHPLQLFLKADGAPAPISPYIAVGLGYYKFNPQAKYNNRYVDLQPLSTEGQGFAEYRTTRERYNRTQSNLIFGAGLKYELSHRFTLRGEFLLRKLFTDYLDDVGSGGFIDPALFAANLSPENAAIAQALYNPNGAPTGSIRGTKSKDAYVTFSLKAAVQLGRQPR